MSTEPQFSLLKNKAIDKFIADNPQIPFSQGGIIIVADVAHYKEKDDSMVTASIKVSARNIAGEVMGYKTYQGSGIKGSVSIKLK